jgi:hypothetical protein
LLTAIGICFPGGPSLTCAVTQYEDILGLGNLLLRLACKSYTGSRVIEDQLQYVKTHYSAELRDVLAYMLTKGATIEGLAEALAMRSMEELEKTCTCAEGLETELAKQLENGRIVRCGLS